MFSTSVAEFPVEIDVKSTLVKYTGENGIVSIWKGKDEIKANMEREAARR